MSDFNQKNATKLSSQEEEFYQRINNYLNKLEEHLAECTEKECHLRSLWA